MKNMLRIPLWQSYLASILSIKLNFKNKYVTATSKMNLIIKKNLFYLKTKGGSN